MDNRSYVFCFGSGSVGGIYSEWTLCKACYADGETLCCPQGLSSKSLDAEFGSRVRYYGEEAGLHLLIELESNAEEHRIAELALRYGVRVYPASSYFVGIKPQGPVFLLGYSNLTENQIKMGVNRLMLAETEAAVSTRT